MRSSTRLVGLALIVIASSLVFAIQVPTGQSEYHRLLTRLKAGDLSVDFKPLRFSFLESPEEASAKDTTEEKKKMVAAINSKNFEEALKQSNVVLANEFIDIDAQFAAYIAHRELHQDDEAKYHLAIMQGLLRSILDSGDGKTEETAYAVINTHEEYVILRYFRLMPEMQSLVNANGHSYDVLKAKNAENQQEVTLYFNIDASMEQLRKALGPK